jgi:hypothetical protein
MKTVESKALALIKLLKEKGFDSKKVIDELFEIIQIEKNNPLNL